MVENNILRGGNRLHSDQSRKYFPKALKTDNQISAGADGGSRFRVCARRPINTSGNFPVHVYAESPSNISPNPSEVISEVSEP